LSTRKRLEIEVERPVGVKSPFWSGGSFRIVLPGWMARKYGKVKRHQPITEEGGLDEVSFLFYPTDKGILMVPLDVAARDPDLRDTLGFRGALRRRQITQLLFELDRKLEGSELPLEEKIEFKIEPTQVVSHLTKTAEELVDSLGISDKEKQALLEEARFQIGSEIERAGLNVSADGTEMIVKYLLGLSLYAAYCIREGVLK